MVINQVANGNVKGKNNSMNLILQNMDYNRFMFFGNLTQEQLQTLKQMREFVDKISDNKKSLECAGN